MDYTFAKFGKTITLAVPSIEEASSLPTASQVYVWEYGMKQTLSDSFARAKDVAEFEAFLLSRWDKIKAGTIATRETGPQDPLMTELRKIVRSTIDAALRAKGKKIPATAEGKALYISLCQQYAKANEAALLEKAQANLDAAKNAAGDVDLEALGLSV